MTEHEGSDDEDRASIGNADNMPPASSRTSRVLIGRTLLDLIPDFAQQVAINSLIATAPGSTQR